MTTINLHQEQKREDLLRGAGKINDSLVFFLVIFLLVAIFYGGLAFKVSAIEKQNSAIKNQIVAENEAFNGKKSVDEVIDLQTRLKEIKQEFATKIEINDTLDNVAKVVISGVSFASYNITGKKLLITLRAPSFDSVSKQVFNFKQAEFVSSVDVVNLVRDEKGIKCDLRLNLK